MNRFLYVAAAVAVVVSVFVFQGEEKVEDKVSLTTEAVDKGNIRKIVTASGSVNPVIKVEVGSQVSGQIIELYKDFNDTVKEGELIAKIDPQRFEMQVKRQEADLKIAQSTVLQQHALVKSEEANFENAKRQYERQKQLKNEGIASEAAYDNAELAYQLSVQKLAITNAQLENAKAVVDQRQSSLEQARVDLEYCFIRSPINGVVIGRNVNIGQTVAASFSAPILFQLAQDLREIRVEASVDEADIGNVNEGQDVSFTVDAYDGRRFEGKVEQVRYAAVVEQNVVTYTVTILANNRELLLLPGMTANVEIVTGQRDDVLRIPNAAFRFQPTPDQMPEGAGQQSGGGFGQGGGFNPDVFAERMVSRMRGQVTLTDEQADKVTDKLKEIFAEGASAMRHLRGGGLYDKLSDILSADQIAKLKEASQQAREQSRGNRGRMASVWMEGGANGKLEQKFVRIGVQDDLYTEVLGGQIKEGDAVITGISR